MKKPKVVFLGSRPLGKFALQFLLERDDIDLIGKITLPDYSGNYWLEDPSDITLVPTIDLAELEHIDFDIGISVNFWKIVRPTLLHRARIGFYNIHHSYNLGYRGLNINTFAILRARGLNRWHHGTTLHRMDEKIDSGEIIASYSCNITESDTAKSLFSKVETLSRNMIIDWFPRLWREKLYTVKLGEEYEYFGRSDLISREISLNDTPLQIYDHVRSMTFPPIERPYVIDQNLKLYLTISRNEASGGMFVDAGQNRMVYFLNKREV
jgi:methionyl-tRNA formyltransferase